MILNWVHLYRNKPEALLGTAICGNGFVEYGEQCDCGLSQTCNGNVCCDPNTCMFYPNVTCATGKCCDQKVLLYTTYIHWFNLI